MINSKIRNLNKDCFIDEIILSDYPQHDMITQNSTLFIMKIRHVATLQK